MSILGGFEGLLYRSATELGTAYNIGVCSRLAPVVDPGNIDIAGTGKRGLYDILLGMIEPKFTLDILPAAGDDHTDGIKFIADYQDGNTALAWLHLQFGALGLTFYNVYMNTVSVICRHNAAISATIEFWADYGKALAQTNTSKVITPYRWLASVFDIDNVPETQWWEWRYDVANNLQRLGSVTTTGTRSIESRHRRVTGSLVKDLRSFTEFIDIMGPGLPAPAGETSKFEVEITVATPGCSVDPTTLIEADGRWGPLEAPTGPEDLIAKRFPFTLLDLT